MKIGVILSLLLLASTAFAEVSVNVQCKVKETARGTSSHIKTQMITLSSEGEQTLAIAPVLSMDRGAIFLLSLSKGNIYTDALGDEVGADHFLSLTRIQNKTKQLKTKRISGKTQDMLTMTEKEGFLESVAYRTGDGKLLKKTPEALRLKYSIKGNKKISVTCEIIN
jgi:hypothetical protein